MTEIVVSVSGSVAECLAQTQQAQIAGADVVELRVDRCVDPAAVISALSRFALPVLLTIRHPSEGGGWAGSEAERLALFQAADGRARAIDIELAHFSALAWRPARSQLVLSHHDFNGMGGDLSAVVAAMRAAGATIAKVAVTPSDAADLGVIQQLYANKSGPLVAIAMGEYGFASRLLAGVWGAAFTFARLDGDAGSAPGQPLVAELIGRYRLREHSDKTRIFGVIGNPVGHSLSPLIHNAAFAALGLDAVYVPFRVVDAAAFWRACGTWIEGLSITIPHKTALISGMNRVEPLVTASGAMNTVWRDEAGAAIGANTDALAIQRCLEETVATLRGRRILVLGAGGVSRAIVTASQAAGAIVAVTNRTHARAEELARHTGATALTAAAALAWPYDVLVNGTAVGMGAPDESPWPAAAHRAGTVVFDTVYTPLETRLLKDAQAAHCRTICGLSMFIAQAAAQCERWTGQHAPEALMQRLALERLAAPPKPLKQP